MALKKLKDGFSLIELSIVLVIIGAIVASIMAGSALIRQSELRSLVSDLQMYHAAYNSFVVKYDRVPGDMENATVYWPNDGQCLEVVAGNEVYCNGNGNESIEGSKGDIDQDEVHQALKHLSLAGMINATISVVATTPLSLQIGNTAPGSKIQDAGYFYGSGYAVSLFSPTTNAVFIGRETEITAGNPLINSALTPEDAYSIDQKIDDAKQLAAIESLIEKLITNFVNPAFAAISGGGGRGGVGGGSTTSFAGADTGAIRAQSGLDATSSSCTASTTSGGIGYDLTVTTDACILGFAVN
jgi:prepilin-type N-terminal cleavage/methylation domain-containing protein